MSQLTFDTLSYFEKLKAAGVPEQQAKVQVEVMQSVADSYDKASRKELATKGDIQDVRTEIQNIRHELVEKINASHQSLVKWFVSTTVAIISVIVASAGIVIALVMMK